LASPLLHEPGFPRFDKEGDRLAETSPPSVSLTESPTGCTKQLISVAPSPVPAAELMRPPITTPSRSWASKKTASHFDGLLSLAARARATRRRTSETVVSPSFAYFSSRTSVEIGCCSITFISMFELQKQKAAPEGSL